LDDRQRRFKDLIDIRNLLLRYEQDNDDRRFSDAVFVANLPDIEYAGAFLMGQDVASLCTLEELDLVRSFIRGVLDPDNPSHSDYGRASRTIHTREESIRWQELESFEKGLTFGATTIG